jgi:two-component system, sensor histidine kinase and response regulator
MTRILVVEDSATQAQALEIILTSEKYEVEVAPDGEQGLKCMDAKVFDLVISDILMPGMSGYELCRNVKGNRATKDVPVILLTTLSDPLDIIRGLESGADNFITKPYEASYLVRRVHTMLTNRRLRAEASVRLGVEIFFLGKRFTITSEKEQILDLLMSTFEDIVRTNRELKASQEALAAANKELEAFSYSVSHDLQAPLRSIDGFSKALAEDCADRLNDSGVDYIKRIHGAVERMTQLIDDLLGLARVSRGELRRSTVELGELIRGCAEELDRRDPSRSVEWSIADGLAANGDPRLLKIVLENLLGNARKFTGARARARIEVGSTQRGTERVYFVRDNGAGFDMRYADKLFAPFQRLHSAAEFEGTGVGLATVQRIVHRHGGRIWAESELDKGATFFFTLGHNSD